MRNVHVTMRPDPGARLWSDVPILPGLRYHRLRRALSQDELAKLSGLSRPTILALERGRPAWPRTIRKLAKALHVRPEELMQDRS